MLSVVWLVCFWQTTAAAQSATPEKTVAQWTRFEAQFTGTTDSSNPLQDLQVEVDFTAPSGRRQTVAAFWDGYKIWRVRFSPEEVGRWTYRTRSSRPQDAGLHNQTGGFVCVAYRGVNPLYRHGALRVSADRHYLTQADGTPFFWLGDTAWNGPLKADARSWQTYLQDRAAKGFNVIKFVATQWRAALGNADGRGAWYGRERIEVDPVFFQWMDERLDAINAAGMVGAPVLLWTHTPSTQQFNPGLLLPDDQLSLLAKYMVARWGAHQVVWLLAGDGDYREAKAERWRKIGRAVFGDQPLPRLATMHPGGRMWVQDEFKDEPWFSFVGYQTSHGASDETHRWTVTEPARHWQAAVGQNSPTFPLINLEPNYEGHLARPSNRAFTAYEVRRAAYWSVLAAPPAGVSYGAHGIWSWETQPQAPMTHAYTGTAQAWPVAMKLPGSVSMQHLKTLFAGLAWYELRPAPELLVTQPGSATPAQFISAARSANAVVVYIPLGGAVELRTAQLPGHWVAEWFHPATGVRTPLGRVANQATRTFQARGTGDWVLVLRRR